MILELVRTERTNHSTLGTLDVDGSFFCFTLEDPVRPVNLKIPGHTAIPAGRYRVQVTWSPRFKQRMPLLIGVPNFSGIRIHPGNTASDTEGCILVGYDRGPDRLNRSRAAYDDLLNQINLAIAAGEDIHIEITDAFEKA